MDGYYTRDGRPAEDWRDAFPTGDFEKDRRVARTKGGGYDVSTVFLGLNHAYGDGPPLIFETMVFTDDDEWRDVDSDRYSTEEQARKGHAAKVAQWTKGGAA